MLVKKIFLSGASGFVGRQLTKYLNKKKFEVERVVYKSPIYEKSIKVDLTKRIYLKKEFDWIIHTAAHHKIEDFKIQPKVKGLRNILMVKNLIKFAKVNKIKNFIYFSTIDINYKPYPLKKRVYCRSKSFCEKILLNAVKKNILKKLIILRLPAIVGENSGNNFIKNTLHNLKKNLPINVWNMNNKYNNLIHINDLNKLIFYLISNKKEKKKIIVDCLASKPIKLKKLINYLKKKLRSASKINYISKKNEFKKINFNRKIGYSFLSVKKTINLLI